MVSIPEMNFPKFNTSTPPRNKKKAKIMEESPFKKDNKILKARLKEIDHSINVLNQERNKIAYKLMVNRTYKRKGEPLKVKLYALELENQCWYIGMSFNVERRFKKHSKGKGAQWTKLHKPKKIHEIRETEHTLQVSAASMEDDMTIEYALKYGSDKVRGGGFCQKKPKWSSIVLENEALTI